MGQLLTNLDMVQSSELYMALRSSDACSGPEHELPFILSRNCSEILALPVGPFKSHSARSRFALCLETVRLASPPDPLILRCRFDDHGAVAAVIEQAL